MGVETSGEHRVTIMVDGDVTIFGCAEQTPVLDGLATIHRGPITSGCRGGGCGVCRVLVRHGRYRSGPVSRAHITHDDERAGFALACRLFPRSDLELEAVGRLSPRRRHRPDTRPTEETTCE